MSTALYHDPPDTSNNRSEVIDGSEAIFAMYLEMSLRDDKATVEGWNQDAKSILLFVSCPLLRSPLQHLMIAERVILCRGCVSLGTELAEP